MKGETQQGNQRFWLARDGGVSWGGKTFSAETWKVSGKPGQLVTLTGSASDSPGENRFQTRSSTGGTPEPAFESILLHSEVQETQLRLSHKHWSLAPRACGDDSVRAHPLLGTKGSQVFPCVLCLPFSGEGDDSDNGDEGSSHSHIIPTLQMRKLKLRDNRLLAQSHTTSKWQSQDS